MAETKKDRNKRLEKVNKTKARYKAHNLEKYAKKVKSKGKK